MEFLIGVILAGVTELVKMLSERFGQKITTALVYSVLFIGSCVYAYMSSTGFFTTTAFTSAMSILTSAIGVYELLIKRVVKPLFLEENN